MFIRIIIKSLIYLKLILIKEIGINLNLKSHTLIIIIIDNNNKYR